MKVVKLKSLICSKNHTFDFSKQGYLNLLPHPSQSHYHKELFEARQKIILESNLYSSLHEKIANIILEYLNHARFPSLILDAGCGEGSHLQKILEGCKKKEMIGVGLDIAKEGIIMAAKKYKEPIWLVGDLANLPLENQTFHVILNILSPSNYKEFKRILVSNGLVIKVVPRKNYLKELREALFNNTNKKFYTNDDTVQLFQKHFDLKEVIPLSYVKKLNRSELEYLVQMSPLSWSAEKADIDAFLNRESSEITIDFDILIGLNK